MKLSNLLQWLLLAFGRQWAPKILAALESVPPALPLAEAKKSLCEAVQHCDPDSGPTRVSGTLRGLICKAFNAAPDQTTLALEVAQLVGLLEKYLPVES